MESLIAANTAIKKKFRQQCRGTNKKNIEISYARKLLLFFPVSFAWTDIFIKKNLESKTDNYTGLSLREPHKK